VKYWPLFFTFITYNLHFGGSVVLTMVNAGADIQTAAAFHAGLQLPVQPEKGKIKTSKVLVCNGGADPMIPEEDVSSFKKSMKDAGVDLKYITYEGAQHAFTNPGASELGKKFNLPLAYDAKADQESWTELKNLWLRHSEISQIGVVITYPCFLPL